MAQLRVHLADSPVMKTLHDLAYKAARDIESVAYDITRKKSSYPEISYEPEMDAIEAELAAVQRRIDEGKPQHEALAVLRAQRNKIRAIIKMIGELHQASQKVYDTRRSGSTPTWARSCRSKSTSCGDPVAPAHGFADLPLLAARGDGDLGRPGRRRMAAVCGAQLLDRADHRDHPQAQLQHDQAARSDRIIGTIIGCVITALIIKFLNFPAAILGILILSTVATPTFIYLRYRYAAIAVSIMILLQMHLIAPGNQDLIMERLIDTFIGAAVATAFSFVLASWEYQSLPRLIREVLDVNLRYMQASFDLLQGQGQGRFRLPHRAQAPDGQPGLAQLRAGAHAGRTGAQAAGGGRHQFVHRAELPAGGARGSPARHPAPAREGTADGAGQRHAARKPRAGGHGAGAGAGAEDLRGVQGGRRTAGCDSPGACCRCRCRQRSLVRLAAGPAPHPPAASGRRQDHRPQRSHRTRRGVG
jgi:hypothetical protein